MVSGRFFLKQIGGLVVGLLPAKLQVNAFAATSGSLAGGSGFRHNPPPRKASRMFW